MATSAEEARRKNAQAVEQAAADRQTFQDRFSKISVEQDAYGRWKLVENIDGKTYEKFLLIQDNGTGIGLADGQLPTAAQTVQYYKKEALRKGGLDKLRSTLYSKGFLSKAEYESKDEAAFNNSIVEAAMSHSIEQSQKYSIEGKMVFDPFFEWLGARTSTAKGEGADAQRELTDKLNAYQDINAFTMDMLGRPASGEEKALYYQKLNTEQKKAIRKTTVSGGIATTTGEGLNQEDMFRIMSEVITPSVKGTKFEDIAKSGGLIASQVVDIKEYARDYGIQLSTEDALNKVLSGFKVGGSLDKRSTADLRTTIRETAKSFYANLAPQIDAGVSIRDISKQFAAQKARILELNEDSIDLFDNDIQEAVRNNGKPGVMSMTDYLIKLRRDPRWSKTQNAREEAANYANNILQSFGLMA